VDAVFHWFLPSGRVGANFGECKPGKRHYPGKGH
jgi:hypothetical protein